MNQKRESENQAPVPGVRELDLKQLPQRDLWPEIATRLQPRRQRGWPGWLGYAAAASVVAMIALTLLGDSGALRGTASPAAEFAVSANQGGEMMAWAPPENAALVKANLRIVRDAESQLRHALEQAPESKSLQRQLQRMQGQRQNLRSLMRQAGQQPEAQHNETGA